MYIKVVLEFVYGEETKEENFRNGLHAVELVP